MEGTVPLAAVEGSRLPIKKEFSGILFTLQSFWIVNIHDRYGNLSKYSTIASKKGTKTVTDNKKPFLHSTVCMRAAGWCE